MVGGFALFGGFSAGCGGQEGRLAALQELDLFRKAPEGSRPVAGQEVSANCVEDSGDAWMEASLDYTYDGDATKVLDHYRATLPGLGWRQVASPRVGETCFERETGAGRAAARIRFADLNLQDRTYRVFAVAAVDGDGSCSD
ncbi:hypothetical protein GCM10010193_45410 [Kitasatospora atroaurantiaca]